MTTWSTPPAPRQELLPTTKLCSRPVEAIDRSRKTSRPNWSNQSRMSDLDYENRIYPKSHSDSYQRTAGVTCCSALLTRLPSGVKPFLRRRSGGVAAREDGSRHAEDAELRSSVCPAVWWSEHGRSEFPASYDLRESMAEHPRGRRERQRGDDGQGPKVV